jgi:large subunit ribosomal protein L28
MAKCAICDKASLWGSVLSHSRSRLSGKHNREWKSNVKHVKIKVNGRTVTTYVCTSCLRAGKVERA